MKRTPLARKSGFKQKTLAEVQAKQAAKRSKMPQDKSKKTRATKSPSKGYKPPKWFTAIKAGSHGNTPAQKKYWKVVSEHVRKSDFDKYSGKCVSCNTVLSDWREGDCAHWRAWSLCNAWMKYELKNLALSCKGCNRASDGAIGYHFGEELKRRHGDNILSWIESENEKYRGQKMEVWEIVDKVSQLRPDIVK